MIGVCFYFEEGTSKETYPGIITQWYMSANAWRIDQLIFIDRTKNAGREWNISAVQGFPGPKIPVTRYEDFSKFYNDSKTKCVFFEVKKQSPGMNLTNARNLVSYEHPANAIYVFGGELWGGIKQLGPEVEGDWVYIPNDGPGTGLSTANIALYDRRVKSTQRAVDHAVEDSLKKAAGQVELAIRARDRAQLDLQIWKEAAGSHAKAIEQRAAADRAALIRLEKF